VQFTNVCRVGRPSTLTQQNIFKIELLCKEWEITDRGILDEAEDFIRNPPGAAAVFLMAARSRRPEG
jgi:hypothetical protein